MNLKPFVAMALMTVVAWTTLASSTADAYAPANNNSYRWTETSKQLPNGGVEIQRTGWIRTRFVNTAFAIRPFFDLVGTDFEGAGLNWVAVNFYGVAAGTRVSLFAGGLYGTSLINPWGDVYFQTVAPYGLTRNFNDLGFEVVGLADITSITVSVTVWPKQNVPAPLPQPEPCPPEAPVPPAEPVN